MLKYRILVVDDEESQREMLAGHLKNEGYAVTTAESGESALEICKKNFFEVALLDLRMPGLSGLDLLNRLKEINPDTTSIIITAYGSIESAVEALKSGAFDYITKPISNLEELDLLIEKALETHSLLRENRALKEELEKFAGRLEIIGESRQIKEVFSSVARVAFRSGDPPSLGESEREFRSGQLRRPPGNAFGIGAFRPREGSLHRRQRKARRKVRIGSRIYRLNVVRIHIPPLRERKGDISILTNYFLEKLSRKNRKKITGITPEVRDLLIRYDWPGNVRELENVLERAVVMCRGEVIDLGDLPPRLSEKIAVEKELKPSGSLREMERKLIREALEVTSWNFTEAAAILGIHRNTLRLKLKEYGIEKQK